MNGHPSNNRGNIKTISVLLKMNKKKTIVIINKTKQSVVQMFYEKGGSGGIIMLFTVQQHSIFIRVTNISFIY